MPKGRFIGEASFSPEDVYAMATAFDGVLTDLGLVDRNDPLAQIVAKKIIEIARLGERDPDRICELALKDIRGLIPPRLGRCGKRGFVMDNLIEP